MEQDPRIRPMSPEENAAYRGVTVDESGAEPQDEARLYLWRGAWFCALCPHRDRDTAPFAVFEHCMGGCVCGTPCGIPLCRAARDCHDSRGRPDRRNDPPSHRSEPRDVVDRTAAVREIDFGERELYLRLLAR